MTFQLLSKENICVENNPLINSEADIARGGMPYLSTDRRVLGGTGRTASENSLYVIGNDSARNANLVT
jgi:hypothetical protein